MLFESAHVRVTGEYGTATLWLDFPGEPVNALDLARLREIDAALAAVGANPFVRILFVRSAKPAGFCAGLRPEAVASLTTDADRAAFAWYGQQVCVRLAGLGAATLALIDGPCLGAGLELALACDHRLVVARPTTLLGFPDTPRGLPPCFGGTARLRQQLGRRADQLLASGRTLSGREARSLGLVDQAFCERRAKIELRTYLDRLERHDDPRKPRPLGETGHAAERRTFARSLDTPAGRATIARQLAAVPISPFPAVVGLAGDDEFAAQVVADAVLRGSDAVITGDHAGVFAGIAIALARGFITPLEADQARSRVKAGDDFGRAGLVFVAEGESPDDLASRVRPRCVVARLGETPDDFPHARRVIGLRSGRTASEGVSLVPTSVTDPHTVVTLTGWLRASGFDVSVTPARARFRVAA